MQTVKWNMLSLTLCRLADLDSKRLPPHYNGMNPLVAIGLAAYQPDKRYFFEQLKSIQDQTYTNWICVITADSPVDLPPELARESRFRLSLNPIRKGAVKNFEESARLALKLNPDYIAFSDQDDLWHPTKLERSLSFLNHQPPLSAVHTDMRVIDANGQVLSPSAWEFERRGVHNTGVVDLLIRNVVAGCASLMDAKLVEKYLNIPPGVPMHDQWYPLLASRHGGMYSLPESTYDYRIHGSNVAGATEFSGLFQAPSLPGAPRKGGALKRWCQVATRRYEETRAKAAGLKQYGELRPWENLVFLSPWDGGLFFLFYGLFKFWNDPMLARSSWARFIGKNIYYAQTLISRRPS